MNPNNESEQQKKDLQTRLDITELQKKLLDAQNALRAAQQAPDPAKKALQDQVDAANAAKAVADAQKAASEAQKAQADAKSAAQKANLPGVDVKGLEGKVGVTGDKVGLLEGNLLATAAVIEASEEIAVRVAAVAATGSVLVFAAGDLPTFSALVLYRTQLELGKTGLEEALKMPPWIVSADALPVLKEAGTVLDSVTKLLSFFKSDFSVAGVEVSLDDAQLVNSVANKLRGSTRTVFIPAIFNPQLFAAKSTFLQDFIAVAILRQAAADGISKLQPQSDELKRQLDGETDESKKKDLQDRLETIGEKSVALKAAASFFDTLQSKLIVFDEKTGAAPLYLLVKEDLLSQMLAKAATHVLLVKIHKAGGGYLIQKNLWSFFGGVPLYHMGGASVSFVLFNSTTGAVEEGGDIPIAGGFVKKNKLKSLLEGIR